MSEYLKFYDLERSVFEDESQSKIVLGTKALRDALAEIRTGLDEGAARICVNGQAGMGKTSLARAMPKLLDDGSRVAVVLRPSASWNSIRSSISKQWKLGEGGLARSNLLSFAREARLVIVVDQAEKASTDILDHLDVLLSYRTEDDQPVVQSVLLANLAANAGEEPAPLIWWLDRIQTLQLQYAPLPRDGVGSYIHKHLKRAGWKSDSLFSTEAAHAVHGYTGGIPGEVDRVCEQILNEAAARNLQQIEADFVHELLDERAEENSSTYDTFEELMMEDEFVGADQSDADDPVEPPSLQDALEHLSQTDDQPMHDPASTTEGLAIDALDDRWKSPQNATSVSSPLNLDSQRGLDTTPPIQSESRPPGGEMADGADSDPLPSSASTNADLERTAPTSRDEVDEEAAETDPELLELAAYLSSPVSAEEMRALHGGLAGYARIAALIAIVVTAGVLLSVWLSDDDESVETAATQSDADAALPRDVASRTLFADPEGLSVALPDQPKLARLRGPVTPESATPAKTRELATTGSSETTTADETRSPAENPSEAEHHALEAPPTGVPGKPVTPPSSVPAAPAGRDLADENRSPKVDRASARADLESTD